MNKNSNLLRKILMYFICLSITASCSNREEVDPNEGSIVDDILSSDRLASYEVWNDSVLIEGFDYSYDDRRRVIKAAAKIQGSASKKRNSHEISYIQDLLIDRISYDLGNTTATLEDVFSITNSQIYEVNQFSSFNDEVDSVKEAQWQYNGARLERVQYIQEFADFFVFTDYDNENRPLFVQNATPELYPWFGRMRYDSTTLNPFRIFPYTYRVYMKLSLGGWPIQQVFGNTDSTLRTRIDYAITTNGNNYPTEIIAYRQDGQFTASGDTISNELDTITYQFSYLP